jgi:hypothetical protein
VRARALCSNGAPRDRAVHPAGAGALITAPRARIASAVRASVLHSTTARVAREPLFRRSRPLCVVTDSVAVLTGEALDEAIKAQGMAVRGLKDAKAPKEQVDAAVGRLLELKAMLPAPGPIELPSNDKGGASAAAAPAASM